MDNQRRTHLFTVRLWREKRADGQVEWRGRLQHVLSGEVRHFRDWPMLLERLEALIYEAEERRKLPNKRSHTEVKRLDDE